MNRRPLRNCALIWVSGEQMTVAEARRKGLLKTGDATIRIPSNPNSTIVKYDNVYEVIP